MKATESNTQPEMVPLRIGQGDFEKLFGAELTHENREALRRNFFKNPETKVPVIWDSRNLLDEPCILVAQRGEQFDPTAFLGNWIDKGHLVITSPDLVAASRAPLDLHRVIQVKNPSLALRKMAELCLESRVYNLTTIGITGTNGKTSCAAILSNLLAQMTHRPVARLGTLGFFDGQNHYENQFPTTPDFPYFCQILNHLARMGTPTLVMEVSSHALAQGRLGDWTFDGAILTNLTPDHLDFHGTIESYWEAKKLLFTQHLKPQAPAAIHCPRSPWMDLALELLSKSHPVALVDCPDACLIRDQHPQTTPLHLAQNLENRAQSGTRSGSSSGLLFSILRESFGPGAKDSVQVSIKAPQLSGQFQAENLSACISLAELLGYDLSALAMASQYLGQIAGRMERVDQPQHSPWAPKVYVDYAHTPDALESALRSLRAEQNPGESLLFVVFGCGGNRDKSKRPSMGQIASIMSDFVIVTSDNPRHEDPTAIIEDIVNGCAPSAKYETIIDRELAIRRAIELAGPSDLILIAGKGHENYQIIGGVKTPFSDAEIARRVLDEAFPSQSSPRTLS